jgi:hypothetical protein
VAVPQPRCPVEQGDLAVRVGGHHAHVDRLQDSLDEPGVPFPVGREHLQRAGLPAPLEERHDDARQVEQPAYLLGPQHLHLVVEDAQRAQRVPRGGDQRRRSVEPDVGEPAGHPRVVPVERVGGGVGHVDEPAGAELDGAHGVGPRRVATLEAHRGELALAGLVDQVERRGRHPGDHRGHPDDGLELVVGGRVHQPVLVQGREASRLVLIALENVGGHVVRSLLTGFAACSARPAR